MADVVVINKVDSAEAHDVERSSTTSRRSTRWRRSCSPSRPPTLEDGPSHRGKRVLVVEDGPTLTHGGMPFGAGLVAARNAGAATIVDPRPYAVGSIGRRLRKCPQLTNVLPAMGYADEQLAELEATINAAECDVVVTGTPIDLGRLISIHAPDPARPLRARGGRRADAGHGPRALRSGRTRSIRC